MEIKIIINDRIVNFCRKVFKRRNILIALIVLLLGVAFFLFAGDLSKPHHFKSGQIISASEINENFDTLYKRGLGTLKDVNVAGISNGKVLKYSNGQWIVDDDIIGGAGSDNMGDCVATNNIQLGSYWLSGDGSNEGITVDANGNVGIGTAVPGYNMDVAGDINFTGTMYQNGSPFGGGGGGYWIQSGSNINYNNGNVGIGTASPECNLDVYSSNGPRMQLSQPGQKWIFDIVPSMNDLRIFDGLNVNLFLKNGGDIGISDVQPDGKFEVNPDSIEDNGDEFIVSTSGNVGIGTTSPTYPLHIKKDNTTNILCLESNITNSIMFTKTGADEWEIFTAGSGPDLYFHLSSKGEIVTLANNGNVGIGTTGPSYLLEVDGTAGKPGGGSWSDSSDRRLKTNMANLDSRTALDKICQLQGVTYNWINPEEHSEGLRACIIAQELEYVFPEWVGEADPKGDDQNLIPQGEKIETVSFPHDFNAYLIEAIKQLKTEIDEKDQRISELEQEIAEIRSILGL